MKVIACLVLILTAALALTGCQSVADPSTLPRLSRGRSENKLSANTTNTVASAGRWHSVLVTPSPEQPRIYTRQKFNPVWWFKNLDDPVPPAWYRPDGKFRTFTWYWRNPFHNFDTYVIGITDKEFVRSGKYPEVIGNPKGGWNFAVSQYNCISLPMLSYHRPKLDFYFGWRPHGSFGIKFNLNPGPKSKAREESLRAKPGAEDAEP